MPQLFFYLFLGIFFLLKYIVKGIAKGAQCSNFYLRNGLRIVMMLTILFSIFYALYVYQKRDIMAFEELMVNVTIENCQNFAEKYPDSKKKAEVEKMINNLYKYELYAIKDSLGFSEFISKYSNNYRYKKVYKQPYIEAAIAGLNLEKQKLAYRRNERMKKAQKDWSSEPNAWEATTKNGTLAMYRQYLKLYPDGAHESQAKKKIIDLEVADVFSSGNYGKLPPMDTKNSRKSASVMVTISNDTQYTLTLLYSGIESKRIVINSRGIQNVRLKSGSYHIVASVTASGIRNFAGTEDLSGGNYSVSYYIR